MSIVVTIKINVMVMVFNVCKRYCIKKPLLGTCTKNDQSTPINRHAKGFKCLIISAVLFICFQRNIFIIWQKGYNPNSPPLEMHPPPPWIQTLWVLAMRPLTAYGWGCMEV